MRFTIALIFSKDVTCVEATGFGKSFSIPDGTIHVTKEIGGQGVY